MCIERCPHGSGGSRYCRLTSYHDAVFAARYAQAQQSDPLRLLGLRLWGNHHRHRACARGYGLPGADPICQVLQSAGADEPVPGGGGHQDRRPAKPPHAHRRLSHRGHTAHGAATADGAGAVRTRRQGAFRRSCSHGGQYAENRALLSAKVYLPRRGTLLKVNNGNNQPTWRGNSKGTIACW